MKFQPFFACLLVSLLAPAACDSGSGGRTVAVVNGVSILDTEYEAQLEYELSWREPDSKVDAEGGPPRMTGEEIEAHVFKEVLVPLAAVRGHYREKIPALLAEAEEIRSKIEPSGANFAELAEQYSKDVNAANGGYWGTLTRRTLYPPIPRVAFTAEEGEIVGPVLSLVGCHLIRIEGKARGMIPSSDTVKASHILLPYEENRPDYMTAILPGILASARVEVLDPEFERLLE